MKKTLMTAMLLVFATFTAAADVVWFDGKTP